MSSFISIAKRLRSIDGGSACCIRVREVTLTQLRTHCSAPGAAVSRAFRRMAGPRCRRRTSTEAGRRNPVTVTIHGFPFPGIPWAVLRRLANEPLPKLILLTLALVEGRLYRHQPRATTAMEIRTSRANVLDAAKRILSFSPSVDRLSSRLSSVVSCGRSTSCKAPFQGPRRHIA